MKKIVLALMITSVFAACGGKQNTDALPVVMVDTAAIQRNAVAAEQARMKADEARLKAEKDSLKIVAQKEVRQERVVTHRTTHSSSSNVGSSETPSSSGSTTVTELEGVSLLPTLLELECVVL